MGKVARELRAHYEGNPVQSICPGETRRVFLASYEKNPDGTQHLYASRVYTLTYDNPTVIASVDVANCAGEFYVVAGNLAIKQTIGSPSGGPGYPDFREGKGGFIERMGAANCQPQPTFIG